MRTAILFGLLLLGGCAVPEQAFPALAALPVPPVPATTPAEREADLTALQARGAATREAGRMVRAGEDLKADLPK